MMIRTFIHHFALDIAIDIFFNNLIRNFTTPVFISADMPTHPCPIAGDMLYDERTCEWFVPEINDGNVVDYWVWDSECQQWFSDEEMSVVNESLITFLKEMKDEKI